MSFIEDNLISDEEILYKAEVSWFVYLNALGWLAMAIVFYVVFRFELAITSSAILIFSLFIVLIALVRFGEAFTHQYFTEIGITSKRMVAKFGFIARETMEIPLNRIESVTIDQSVVERMTCCGTVAVHGTGQTLAPVKFIDDPIRFRNELNEAIAAFKANHASTT